MLLGKVTWHLSVSHETVLNRNYQLDLIKLIHNQMQLSFNSEMPNVSYSGIIGFCRYSQDFCTFYPEETYQLSLGGLDEPAAKAIAHLDLGDRLTCLGATFEVGDRTDETTSYEALYQTLVANEPEPIKQFQLKFSTPTAFAQGSTQLPLPIPSLMIRSWLERWNHFAPIYLGSNDLVGYLEQALVIRRHKLQTSTCKIYAGRVTGFKGDVTLQILNRTDPLLANVAHLLIRYANFAGTGIKTRLGMGQTIFSELSKTSES